MQTYEPLAGTRIDAACRKAVALAVENNTEVRFTFNGVALSAMPFDKPQFLADRWHAIFEANQRAYRNSPEGKAAQAKRDAEIVRKQAALDACIAALPKILRTDNHLDAVVNWVTELIDPADDVATKWNPNEAADQLEAAGYVHNEHVGQRPEWFNTRERLGRYIIGQAISCMRRGLPPHPVATSFAEKYFKLPAR